MSKYVIEFEVEECQSEDEKECVVADVHEENCGCVGTYSCKVEISPYRPAKVSGPPEDCYPEEGGVEGDPFDFQKEGANLKDVPDWLMRRGLEEAQSFYERGGDADPDYYDED